MALNNLMDKDHKTRGKVVLKPALDFKLVDQHEKQFHLFSNLKEKATLLAFYPGGFVKNICAGQFCDYRDQYSIFEEYGVEIVGISKDPPRKQLAFSEVNNYPFRFLHDVYNKIAKKYHCHSPLMLNTISRAIFIINQKGLILYKYVEPTILSKRGSGELIDIIGDLKENKIL